MYTFYDGVLCTPICHMVRSLLCTFFSLLMKVSTFLKKKKKKKKIESIGLCNVLYKIIFKIIAARLNKFLQKNNCSL
jgi:hypothetical protein